MTSSRSRNLYGIIAVLGAMLVIVASLAGLYYFQYTNALSQNSTYVQELRTLGVDYKPNILFDFGNGSKTWYNSTRFQPGTNLYVATQVIANGAVNSTYYPQYGSHFVTSIFDLAGTTSNYWSVWTYNSTASWQMANVGPDQLPILNGSIYAWIYCIGNCTAP